MIIILMKENNIINVKPIIIVNSNECNNND